MLQTIYSLSAFSVTSCGLLLHSSLEQDLETLYFLVNLLVSKESRRTSDCNLEKTLPVASWFPPALVLRLLSLPANHEKEPAFYMVFPGHASQFLVFLIKGV